MAILYMDGFDIYDNFSDLTASATGNTTVANWSAISGGTSTLQTTGGLNGGGRLVAQGNGSGPSGGGIRLDMQGMSISDYQNTFYFSFWANFPQYSTSSSGGTFWRFVDSAAVSTFGLGVDNVGNLLYFTMGGAFVDSGYDIVLNTWTHFEIAVFCGTNDTAGSWEIRINGSTVASATGVDLFNSSSVYPDYIQFQTGRAGSSTDSVYYDDVVVYDSTGSYNNTWMGKNQIDTLVPNNNGSNQDWTPNTGNAWDAINDPIPSDGDTTYISVTDPGKKSEFDLTNLSGVTASIFAVQPRSKIKKVSSNLFGNFRNYILSNGVEADGPPLMTTAGYTWERYKGAAGVFSRNPDGNVAWTDTTINALKLGIESR